MSIPRDRRGSVLIMTMLIIPLAIVLTAIIVNLGSVYAYRAQFQRISDAAAIGELQSANRHTIALTTAGRWQ